MKSLNEIPANKRVIVSELLGGREFASRMAALGFTKGAEVKVLQNYGRGPLITIIRGTRVAIGRGEALKVMVKEIEEV